MGFEVMHSVPGSPQTYCLTLPKFISLWTTLPHGDWYNRMDSSSPIFFGVSCIILCSFCEHLQHAAHLGCLSWGP